MCSLLRSNLGQSSDHLRMWNVVAVEQKTTLVCGMVKEYYTHSRSLLGYAMMHTVCYFIRHNFSQFHPPGRPF